MRCPACDDAVGFIYRETTYRIDGDRQWMALRCGTCGRLCMKPIETVEVDPAYLGEPRPAWTWLTRLRARRQREGD